MKTKFIDISGQKENKETVFTHYLDSINGWLSTDISPVEYEKVVYLGNCNSDGDMFAAYLRRSIVILKGMKGSEFL